MSILQLVFSLFVFFGFLGGAVSLSRLQVGFGGLFGEYVGNPGALTALSIALLTLALFCLPSIISSVYALTGSQQPKWLHLPMKALSWLPLALLALVIGFLFLGGQSLSAHISGMLTALGIALPALWLLGVGAGEQWGKHPQRNAGMLTFSMGFTTFFIMLLELALVIIIVVVLSMFLVNSPQWNQILNDFITLYSSGNTNPEDLLQAFSSLANSGPVLAWLLFLAALVIPLIEVAFQTFKECGCYTVETSRQWKDLSRD